MFERSYSSAEVHEDWKKANVTIYLQEGKERGSMELQAGQAYLNTWDSNGAANLGNHLQTYEG